MIREAIYIGNTQQTLKKINGHFSDLLYLFKNGQKSDSFAAHSEKQFKTTTSRIYLHKYMTFKVVNQLNPIGSMNKFKKPNRNICTEELLMIPKNLHVKHTTVMNKNLEIYGACRHKTTSHQFLLSTDDPVFSG